MLEDLNIKNGKLDLKFDKYNNIYTVTVSESVESLDIDYTVTNGYNVNIINNKLDKNENYVYIKVFNNEIVNTYTLIVNKEIEYSTSLIEDYKKTLEVKDNDFNPNKLLLVGSVCLIILLIIFIMLFKKKKTN